MKRAENLRTQCPELAEALTDFPGSTEALVDLLRLVRHERDAVKTEWEMESSDAKYELKRIAERYQPAVAAADRVLEVGRAELENRPDAPRRRDTHWRLDDAERVPASYWILDEKRILREIRAGLEIPGVSRRVVERIVIR